MAAHRGSEQVAAFFLVEEVRRLCAYSGSSAVGAVRLFEPQDAFVGTTEGYLRQLAGQIPDLSDRRPDELAERLFSKPVVELSSFEASSLIDTLKAIKAGNLSLDASLQATPA